jgi:hypothetical protein
MGNSNVPSEYLKCCGTDPRLWREGVPGEWRLVGTRGPGSEGEGPEVVGVAGTVSWGVDHAAGGAAAFGELEGGAERGIGRDFDAFGFEEAQKVYGHGFRSFHF